MLYFILKPGGKLEYSASLSKFKGNPNIDNCRKSRSSDFVRVSENDVYKQISSLQASYNCDYTAGSLFFSRKERLLSLKENGSRLLL